MTAWTRAQRLRGRMGLVVIRALPAERRILKGRPRRGRIPRRPVQTAEIQEGQAQERPVQTAPIQEESILMQERQRMGQVSVEYRGRALRGPN